MTQQTPQAPSGFGALSVPGQMRSIAVGNPNITLAYFDSHPERRKGEGEAREAVVLLHGLGEHAGYWRENVAAIIAAGYRVIIPDLAGHGRSAKPKRAYTMLWQSELVVALCEALKVDGPFTLVGHSMGGQVALRLALNHPTKVRSLALIAPAGIETFSASEAAWLRRMSTPRGFASRTPSALRAHFQRNVFGRWGHIAEEHLEERVALKEAPGFQAYIQAVVSSIHGMLDDRAAYELGALEVPTYLLFGEEDRLIPNPVLHGGRALEVAQRAQAKLRTLRKLVMLPEVGHMPQIEALHETNELILEAARAGRSPSTSPSPSPALTPEEGADLDADALEGELEGELDDELSGGHEPHTHNTSWSAPMEPILIKRYPNRRLYDTGRSAYITLDELAIDLSSGRRVRVEESKTGRDITKRVLMQALLTDQQARKLSCLPTDFLFTLLQLEDPTMLALFGHYVRSTLSTFSTAQKVTQHNVELMKKLTPNPSQLLSNLNALLHRGDDQGRG